MNPFGLFKVGAFYLSHLKGLNIPMDPLTATQNAIAALFQFLSTPEGQKVVEDFRQLDQAFVSKLKDLFDKLHGNSTPAAPAVK